MKKIDNRSLNSSAIYTMKGSHDQVVVKNMKSDNVNSDYLIHEQAEVVLGQIENN